MSAGRHYSVNHSSKGWNAKTQSQGKNGPASRQCYPAKPENWRKFRRNKQPGLWIPACAGMTGLELFGVGRNSKAAMVFPCA